MLTWTRCDVESVTGKGVFYVGHSKDDTSKRKIPLNGAVRDAITQMLSARTSSGTQGPSITSGREPSTITTTRPSRRSCRGVPMAARRDNNPLVLRYVSIACPSGRHARSVVTFQDLSAAAMFCIPYEAAWTEPTTHPQLRSLPIDSSR